MAASYDFTNYLDTARAFDDPPQVLSVLQLVGVKLGAGLTFALVAKALGVGWGGALLVGGLGGAAAVLVIVVAVVHLWPVVSAWQALPSERRLGSAHATDRTAMIAAWDVDAELDRLCAHPALPARGSDHGRRANPSMGIAA